MHGKPSKPWCRSSRFYCMMSILMIATVIIVPIIRAALSVLVIQMNIAWPFLLGLFVMKILYCYRLQCQFILYEYMCGAHLQCDEHIM